MFKSILGHVLEQLSNPTRGTNKSLSGKGKLTEQIVNSMQNYYLMAIRNNKGALYQIKKAVGAILWHCTLFTDPIYHHRFCPTGATAIFRWKFISHYPKYFCCSVKYAEISLLGPVDFIFIFFVLNSR